MKLTIYLVLIAIMAVLTQAKYHAKIQGELFEDLIENPKTGFQIIMKEHVDFKTLLHPISKIALKNLDHKSKGKLIVNELQRVAKISQQPLINELKDQGISFRSFWISNSIVIDSADSLKSVELLKSLAKRYDVAELISIRSIKIIGDDEKVSVSPKQNNFSRQKTVQWNVKWAKGPELWAKGFSGKGIVVANLDTGITHTHVGLKDIYRGNKGNDQYDHDYNWWDGVRTGRANDCPVSGKVPCDDHGHGTHCIGTQVGSDSQQYVGIAPGAKFIGCRSFFRGSLSSGAVESCMQFMLAPTKQDGTGGNSDLRPDVISHSYGVPDNTALRRAFDASNASGSLNVASAGNSARCSTVARIPGFYADSFTVGALGFQSDRIARFSSKGPGLSAHKLQKPEIAASGERVVSWGRRGGVATMSGTSMSGPLVAGAAALLWSAVPELKNNLEATKKVLQEGAKVITNSECGSPQSSPNYVYGYGNLDIMKSYELAKKMFNKK